MADVIDRVVARHILLLQEISGVALALGKNRDQHIGAGDFLPPGRLHMNDRPLDDALKSRRRLGVLAILTDQIVEFLVDIFAEILSQKIEIDRTGPQHGGGIAILGQTEQQMLKRGIFVMPFIGDGQGPVQRLFEIAGERRHWLQPLTFFP